MRKIKHGIASAARSLNSLKDSLRVACALAVLCEQGFAATYTVTSNNDAGAGSLRDAVTSANADPGSSINFNLGAGQTTITLASSLPSITAGVTIDGSNGGSQVTVSGNNLYQIFNVGAANVVLQNMSVINGVAQGGNGLSNGAGGGGGGAGMGGGLFVDSSAGVTLSNVIFTGNQATGGAGGGGTNTNAVGGSGGAGGGPRGGTNGSSGPAGGGNNTAGTNNGGVSFTGGGGGGTNTFGGGGAGAGGGGGFGAGGGGGGNANGSGGNGGAGGYGGGGGGGGSGWASQGSGGAGTGGGAGGGGSANGIMGGQDGGGGGGGGGAGLGGAIFVRPGGILSISGGSQIDGTNAVGGGAGGGGGPQGAAGGAGGTAKGSGIFLAQNSNIVFAPGAGATVTVGGNIEGDGTDDGIRKNGAGTLSLTGNNAFSGTSILTAGVLSVGHNNALGSAMLNFDGGSLRAGANGLTLVNNMNLGLSAPVDTNGNSLTLSGNISDIPGGTGLVKNGAGTLTLAGNNVYNGGTTINAGTLSINNSGNIGGGNKSLTFNGGALLTTAANFAGDNDVQINGAGGTIQVNAGNSASFNGRFTGAGGLSKSGVGTVTLTNLANNYSGGTTINAGVLSISGDTNLGNVNGGVTFNGGTLQVLTGNGTLVSNRGVTINAGGATIDTRGGSLVLSGPIGGAGGLTYNDTACPGCGSFELSGNNAYGGGTTITSGVLKISSDANLGNAAGGVTLTNAGTLQALGTFSSGRGITLNGGGTLHAGSGATVATYNGIVSGNGGLTIINDPAGGGQVALTGNNTYTGGTTINTGSLGIISDLNLGDGVGGISFGTIGATLTANANINSARAINLVGGGTFNSHGNKATFSGMISGSNGLSIQDDLGGGRVTLSGSNSYTGGTNIMGGATLAVTSNANMGAVGAGNGLNISGGGTLRTDAGFSSGRGITLLGGQGTIELRGFSSNFSGSIKGIGALNVNDNVGGGALNLSGGGNNTYSGGTFINSGATLAIGSDGNLGSGNLTFNGGTLRTLTGAGSITTNRGMVINGAGGTIDTSGGRYIINSVIGGTGVLTLNDKAGGAGSLFLNGANTYSGGTTISSGKLNITNDNNLGALSGGITFNGGTLITGAGILTNRAVTLNGGGGIIDALGSVSTFSGVVSGSGPLTIVDTTGNGGITLSGNNTYSGGTVIDDGILNISSDGNLGNAAGAVTLINDGELTISQDVTSSRNIILNAGGSLNTAGTKIGTFSGMISGNGGLEVENLDGGTGGIILTGNNSYTGGTTIDSGFLAVASDSSLGDAAGGVTIGDKTSALRFTSGVTSARDISLGAGGTLDYTAGNTTLSGTISGAGGLFVKNTGAAGALALTGANTYTGGTSVDGAILAVNSNVALGNLAGDITLKNNGRLKTTGGDVSASRAVTLASGGILDQNGGVFSFSGIIGGGGGLAISNSGSGGRVALSGSNTFTGGVTLNNGATLAVLDDANFGAVGAANKVTANGGTLQALADLVSSRGMVLNAALPLDTNGFNATLSGVLSGAGALNKIGSGTLTLSGANTYAGATTVGAGTLEIGRNNALPVTALSVASGATLRTRNFDQALASLINNGTINAGSSAITVTGNHSGSGTLNLILQSGFTNLTVGGTAALANETLNPSVAAVPEPGQSFTVITAGAINGKFAAINNPAGIYLVPHYSSTDLILFVAVPSFSTLSGDATQNSVGAALDSLRSEGSGGDAETVVNAINTLTTPQAKEALKQVSGSSNASAIGSTGPTFSTLVSGFAGGGGALAMRSNDLRNDESEVERVAYYKVTGDSFSPGGPLLAAAGGSDMGGLNLGDPTGQQSPWGFPRDTCTANR